MRIIARSTLAAFWNRHPSTRPALEHWVRIVEEAEWGSPQDAMDVFRKCKVLNGERIRFEIAGGDFRLIAAFDFARQIAFVKFVGTHAEYDRVDALTVSRF